MSKLILFGYLTESNVLTKAEQAAVQRVGHWYMVRGPWGVIGVAKRDGHVHVVAPRRWKQRETVPNLLKILAWKA